MADEGLELLAAYTRIFTRGLQNTLSDLEQVARVASRTSDVDAIIDVGIDDTGVSSELNVLSREFQEIGTNLGQLPAPAKAAGDALQKVAATDFLRTSDGLRRLSLSLRALPATLLPGGTLLEKLGLAAASAGASIAGLAAVGGSVAAISAPFALAARNADDFAGSMSAAGSVLGQFFGLFTRNELLRDFGNLLGRLVDVGVDFTAWLTGVDPAATRFSQATQRILEGIEKLPEGEQLEILRDRIEDIQAAIEEGGSSVSLQNQLRQLTTIANELARSEAADEIERINKALAETSVPAAFAELQNQLQRIRELELAGFVDADAAEAEAQRLIDAFEELRRELEPFSEATIQLEVEARTTQARQELQSLRREAEVLQRIIAGRLEVGDIQGAEQFRVQLQETLDALEKINLLPIADELNALVEKTKTPLQELEDLAGRVVEAWQRGLISTQQAAEGIGAALVGFQRDFDLSINVDAVSGQTGLQAGTQESLQLQRELERNRQQEQKAQALQAQRFQELLGFLGQQFQVLVAAVTSDDESTPPAIFVPTERG